MNPDSTAQVVTPLAAAWAAAELQGDVPFLEQLLTEDFVGVGPLGFLLSKQEWLARHQSGEMKYSAHTFDDARARVYHGAAIVIGRLTQQATYQGNPINAQLRTTLLFIQHDDQWRLAGL